MTDLLAHKRVRVASATLLTVIAALLLPLLVHLLPASGTPPLGARLLPIFYAPLLAAVFFGPVASLAASVLAPFANLALTGRPPLPLATQLSAELLIFTGVVLGLGRRWPRFALAAPLAYVVARTVTFFALTPTSVTTGGSWAALFASLGAALPGIVVLTLLNVVAVRLRPLRPLRQRTPR